MRYRVIVFAILITLYILQNNIFIFSGLLEFFATQESWHEPSISSCNHNNNTSLPFA